MMPRVDIYDFVVYDYDLGVSRAVARLQVVSDEDEGLKILILRGNAAHLSHFYQREIKVVRCEAETNGVNKRGTVLFSVRDS